MHVFKQKTTAGTDASAFTNMTFAGWPCCEAVAGNPAARDMCEAQQGVFVEGSCAEQSGE